MAGPQFVEDEDERKNWRRHLPTGGIFVAFALILLLLISDLRNFVFSPFLPLLDWTRDQGNASAVQAISATLQAGGTALLLAFTWHQIRLSREDATSARRQARAAYHQALASERKASIGELRREKLVTMPVLVLLDPTSKRNFFDEVQFTVSNVGQGPALHVKVIVTQLHMPYVSKSKGELRPLLVGASTTVHLELERILAAVVLDQDILEEKSDEPRRPRNSYGWLELADVTVACMDVRGEMWESGATLTYDPQVGGFRFFGAWFSFPAEVAFGP